MTEQRNEAYGNPIKSFSPEQIQEAITEAIAKLTGQEGVVVEINNIEYKEPLTDVWSSFEKYIKIDEGLSCNIHIKSHYQTKNEKYNEEEH